MHAAKTACAALLGLFASLGLPALAAANPLDAFGLGARSIAMGGAVTSLVDDVSANYYNPAGLARSERLQLEFGYIYADPTLTINGGDLNVDASRGFQGGVLMPGRLLDRRVAVSLGLHLPDERVARLRALPQSQPRFTLYDNRPQRLTISASGAVEIVEGLTLGAGLTFLANTVGTLSLGGQLDIAQVEQTTLLSSLDVDLAAIRYLTAGVLWEAGEHLRLGVTFRDEFKLRLDLGVEVIGDLAFNGNVVQEDVTFKVMTYNVNLFSPRQVAFGVGWEEERWQASLDVTWVQWSRFPPPASRIEVTLDERLASIAALPPFEVPLSPAFHDILVLRAGGELQLYRGPVLEVLSRAGYVWEPSPAPEQPGITNYVDLDKHAVSLGLGLTLEEWIDLFPGPVGLDLTGQLIHLRPRAYLKDDPADPVGDFEARGHIWSGSLMTRFHF